VTAICVTGDPPQIHDAARQVERAELSLPGQPRPRLPDGEGIRPLGVAATTGR